MCLSVAGQKHSLVIFKTKRFDSSWHNYLVIRGSDGFRFKSLSLMIWQLLCNSRSWLLFCFHCIRLDITGLRQTSTQTT